MYGKAGFLIKSVLIECLFHNAKPESSDSGFFCILRQILKNCIIMRKIFYFFFISILFFSCSGDKEYIYIEKREQVFPDSGIIEKEPKKILASNDSAAYCKAYQNFCISIKSRQMTQERLKITESEVLTDKPL